MRGIFVLLALCMELATARPFSVGDTVLLSAFGKVQARGCLASGKPKTWGLVIRDDGSSVLAYKVACLSLGGSSAAADVPDSWYDDLELVKYTTEELAALFVLGKDKVTAPPSRPPLGPTAAEAATCAAHQTCGSCAAERDVNCKWCSGQHECKPASTNEVCTHDYYTFQQCELQGNHADGWFELPRSSKDEYYATFHFTPAKSGWFSKASNAIGILVSPFKDTVGATPVLLEQATSLASGAERCKDPIDGRFVPTDFCNFDTEAEITLHVRKGAVAIGAFSGNNSNFQYVSFGPAFSTAGGWWRLTSKGGTISRVEVITEEELYVSNHVKQGAQLAAAGVSSKCGPGSAVCGNACWGVCEACGPPRYCMCYPNGYTGVSGAFHPGAACLKWDGDGDIAEKPADNQHGHVATEL